MALPIPTAPFAMLLNPIVELFLYYNILPAPTYVIAEIVDVLLGVHVAQEDVAMRCLLQPDGQQRRDRHVRDGSRKQQLPRELHELVIARAAQAGAHPDEQKEQDDDLCAQHERSEPDDVAQNAEGQLVAAEEERGHDGARRDHVDVLCHEEERKLDAAVLRLETGDQFVLCFRQVKRAAVGFRQDADEEEREHQPQPAPFPERTGLLHQRDQAEAAGQDQDADQEDAHRQLVRDHLRGGAQRAEQGIVVVAAPAGQDDAIALDAGDGENPQETDADVGDGGHALGHGNDGPNDEGGNQRQNRRKHVDWLVHAVRDDLFLEDGFDRVGNGL